MSSQNIDDLMDMFDDEPPQQAAPATPAQSPAAPAEQGIAPFATDVWRGAPAAGEPPRPWWRRAPSRKELAEQSRRAAIGQLTAPFHRSKAVLVGNVVGKAGKSTVASLLAAGFGHWSGRASLLLENSPTGTLRNRLETVPTQVHDVDELALHLPDLRGRPDALALLQNLYAVYQNQGRYGVILGRQEDTYPDVDGQLIRKAATLSRAEVSEIIRFAQRVWPFVVVDSGNNCADDAWWGSVDVADLLVLPTTWGGTEIEGATRILHELHKAQGRERQLAWTAVLVVTQPPGTQTNQANKANTATWCRQRGVPVVELPPDPAMAERDKPILWDALKPATHEAVLGLCAAVAERLHASDSPQPAPVPR
jgi:cellulose biosynthesis protein BcsQ